MKSIFKTFILSVLVFAQVHFAFAQTASILPPAKTTFVDQNGKPLTSGTVDFYIPSTTTRKTTWQDAAETVPNANPVVLDGAGRGLILGSGSYRQVVKDRLGNTIWDQVTSSAGTGSTASTATGDGDLVGTIKPWAGLTAPNQYMLTNGAEISRTTFSALFTAITSTQAVFCSSGSPILTGLSDTTNFPVGAAVELSCVVSGTSTIVSKTSSTITLAANSNVNSNVSAIIFPWGNGNHSTTFNIPDFRGLIPVGNNNMGGVASANLTTTFFGVANPNSIGGQGGNQSQVLLTANLPAYTPAGSVSVTSTPTNVAQGTRAVIANGSGATIDAFASGTETNTAIVSTGTITGTAQGGTSAAFSIVPPSRTANYIIKVTPDANAATASGVTSLGGMTGDIGCGTGLLCTGNNISISGLAFGTMSSQNANAVAITGGTITGMPNPSNAADVANKSYVDSTANGLTILAQSTLATAAILPNTPTYANGTLGVGATLTAGSNSTLTVDGTVAVLNNVVLVNNQASAFQNGIYTVTTAGSGSVPWVLTRATYFDQSAEMLKGSYTFITNGVANVNTSWVLAANVTTVGTTAANFNKFSSVTTPTPQCTPANTAGFVGDGVTDNLAAWNTWKGTIASASGCLEFGVGKFSFSANATLTMANARQYIQIRGLGQDASILYWPAGGGMTITAANALNSINVNNLTYSTGAVNTGSALLLTSPGITNGFTASQSTIRNVNIRGDDYTDVSANSDYWLVGLNIVGWSNVNIDTLNTYGLLGAPATAGGGTGLSYGGAGTNISAVLYVNNSNFYFHTIALQLGDYWEGVVISNSNFQGETGNAGIFINSGLTHAGPYLLINKCQFNTGGSQVDILSSINQVQLLGNTITGFGTGSTAAALGSGANNIAVGNMFNVATGTGLVGLQLSGAGGIVGSNIFNGYGTGVFLSGSSSSVNVSQNLYPGGTVTQVSNSGTGNSVGLATK